MSEWLVGWCLVFGVWFLTGVGVCELSGGESVCESDECFEGLSYAFNHIKLAFFTYERCLDLSFLKYITLYHPTYTLILLVF